MFHEPLCECVYAGEHVAFETRTESRDRSPSNRVARAGGWPDLTAKGVGESIYSGFTHNPHHLILDSVIDPKG